MQEVTQWWSQVSGSASPWLMLGKGPSFKRRGEFDLLPYRAISLNHVVREMKVEIASAIDLDVVKDCADAIRTNARYLLMPRYPHVKNQPMEKPLEALFDEVPVLKELSEQGRLVWYNLASAPPVAGSPVIPFGTFSGEVIATLLGTLGARRIRTLGIDGGVSYAAQFKDLNDKTRLANGQPSFDVQAAGIAAAIRKFSLDFGPLTSELPMKIFIGVDETQVLGAKLFEYSVRKHTPVTVEFNWMQSVKFRWPKDVKDHPRTNFSFNRFAIPSLCNYEGRGIYVDADMLVFKDFREVWELPFNGATVMHAKASSPERPKQFSVLLLDCARLKWNVQEIVDGLDEGKYDYEHLMKAFCIVPPEQIQDRIPFEWNSLEHYEEGKTGLIHYTDTWTQPWVCRSNKHGDVWVKYLREAIREGYITMEEIKSAVEQGHARPSLLWQLKLPRRSWGIMRKTVFRAIDLGYKPHAALDKRLEGVARPTYVKDLTPAAAAAVSG
jgi:hypothetical protein